MKYVDEFRDGERARLLAEQIRAEAKPDRAYRLMEFCGGHTHAVFRYGVADLLPDNIELRPPRRPPVRRPAPCIRSTGTKRAAG